MEDVDIDMIRNMLGDELDMSGDYTYAPVEVEETVSEQNENRWGKWMAQGARLQQEMGTASVFYSVDNWDELEEKGYLETSPLAAQATPVEELMATIGLVNVDAAYRGTPLPHDFRMLTDASHFLYNGMPVLEMRFPACKLDLLPETVAKNLSRNVDGRRQVVTGTGRHLFMGAIECVGEPQVIFSIATYLESAYFLMERTTIRKVNPQPEAWIIGGTPIFTADGREQWRDAISPRQSAVVMVDGNYWWAPYERWVPMLSSGLHLHDRNNRVFDLQVEIPAGLWEVNLDELGSYRETKRPPVSYELLRAWQKLPRLHSVFFSTTPKDVCSFVVSAQEFNLSKAPQCYNEDSTLMSLHMVSVLHKPKGLRMRDFLISQSDTKPGKCDCSGGDIFHFYAWSMSHGYLWSTMEMYSGRSDVRDQYGGVLVVVPNALREKLLKVGAREDVDEPRAVWLMGSWRMRNLLSCFSRGRSTFAVRKWRRLRARPVD